MSCVLPSQYQGAPEVGALQLRGLVACKLRGEQGDPVLHGACYREYKVDVFVSVDAVTADGGTSVFFPLRVTQCLLGNAAPVDGSKKCCASPKTGTVEGKSCARRPVQIVVRLSRHHL